MDVKQTSLRSPLNRVRGLGSAKNGTYHWLMQRMTAVVLIPLLALLLYGFVRQVILGDFISTFRWIHLPIIGASMILFLLASFYHAVLGLQVIIEDYVHGELKKMASLIAVRFFGYFFLIVGVVAIIRIQIMELS